MVIRNFALAACLIFVSAFNAIVVGTDVNATAAIQRQQNTVERPSAGDMTVLGITLGHATLRDVQRKIGAARAWSSGDAYTAEEKVCYVTQQIPHIAVVFASNSEMAGPPRNDLTNIRIFDGNTYRYRIECESMNIPPSQIRTTTGLGLGISPETVRTILGRPNKITGSNWRYSNSQERALSTPNGYQHLIITSSISIKFASGNVVAINIHRIESSA